MKKISWHELKPQVKEVWVLSLPAILTQITTIVMQYIDSAMVGSLGANASAAIGLVSTSTWLLGGITYAVSAGFSVQVAHNIGAGRDAEARSVVRHGLCTALCVAGILCALGLSIHSMLPTWLGGDPAIRYDASKYFMVYALMIPFSQINSLNSSFLQCSGDMLTPSILNAAMCLLDVVFNTIFIPHFGVMGAGIGTASACAVVSLTMAWRCLLCNPHLRLNRKETEKHGFDPEILKKALKIGLPVGVQEIAMCSAQVVATMIIAPLGAVSIAANSFAVTAESLCYMPGYGIGSAATTLVGRNIGAGKTDLAKRYGNICIVMGAGFMAITGLLMMFLCPFVFSILTPDLSVRALAAQALRIGLLAEPLYGVSIVAAGALRGTGDTFVPSMMNLGSIWVVRIGLALLLVGSFGLPGMWTAMATELCVRGLLMLYRQKTTKYYKKYNKTTETSEPELLEAAEGRKALRKDAQYGKYGACGNGAAQGKLSLCGVVLLVIQILKLWVDLLKDGAQQCTGIAAFGGDGDDGIFVAHQNDELAVFAVGAEGTLGACPEEVAVTLAAVFDLFGGRFFDPLGGDELLAVPFAVLQQ